MLQLGEADGKDLTSPARRDDQHRVKKRGKTKPAAPRSRYEARQYAYGDDEITAARNLSSRRQLGIPVALLDWNGGLDPTRVRLEGEDG